MGYLEAIERMDKSTGQPTTPKRAWLKAWQELARLTYGIEPGDARLAPVLEALNRCDAAFCADNWATFEQVVRQIKEIMSAEQAAR